MDWLHIHTSMHARTHMHTHTHTYLLHLDLQFLAGYWAEGRALGRGRIAKLSLQLQTSTHIICTYVCTHAGSGTTHRLLFGRKLKKWAQKKIEGILPAQQLGSWHWRLQRRKDSEWSHVPPITMPQHTAITFDCMPATVRGHLGPDVFTEQVYHIIYPQNPLLLFMFLNLAMNLHLHSYSDLAQQCCWTTAPLV